MGKVIDFIKNKLESIHNAYPYLEIKYEYRESIDTHLIEVKPVHCFESDTQYIDSQIDIEEEFEQKFPKEEILFFTENILMQIENPILELGTALIGLDIPETATYIHCPEMEIDSALEQALSALYYPPPIDVNSIIVKKGSVDKQSLSFFI